MSDFGQGFLFCLCLIAIVGLSYFHYAMYQMSKLDEEFDKENKVEKEPELDKCTIRNKDHIG